MVYMYIYRYIYIYGCFRKWWYPHFKQVSATEDPSPKWRTTKGLEPYQNIKWIQMNHKKHHLLSITHTSGLWWTAMLDDRVSQMIPGVFSHQHDMLGCIQFLKVVWSIFSVVFTNVSCSQNTAGLEDSMVAGRMLRNLPVVQNLRKSTLIFFQW